MKVVRVRVRVGRFWDRDGGAEKYSVANSQPKGFKLKTLGWAKPKWVDVKAWKEGAIDWKEFEKRYLETLREHWPVMREWMERIVKEGNDVMLCCWERDETRCHRSVLAYAIRKAAYKLGLPIMVVPVDSTPSPDAYIDSQPRREALDRDIRSGLEDAGEARELMEAQREADADAYERELSQAESLELQGIDPADALDLSRVPLPVKRSLHGPAEEMQLREDVLRYALLQPLGSGGDNGRWWLGPTVRRLQRKLIEPMPNSLGIEFDTVAFNPKGTGW